MCIWNFWREVWCSQILFKVQIEKISKKKRFFGKMLAYILAVYWEMQSAEDCWCWPNFFSYLDFIKTMVGLFQYVTSKK